MHGTLRIFRTPAFSHEWFSEFIKMSLNQHSEFHLLITDGIMMDFRSLFSENILQSIKVQRILTSYQLQKILMDSDDSPYYISATTAVIETWPSAVVESIYDIMKIKTHYRGGIIFLNVVGQSGIFEKYLGNRVLAREYSHRKGGLYSWEEQFQQ